MKFEEIREQAQFRKQEEADNDREKAGHKAERETFDEVRLDEYERIVKERKEEIGGSAHPEEIYFNIYRDAVKESQPFRDATNPQEKQFPFDLHAKVVELLKLDRYEQLRFYTAVGSDLDKKFGTDAFFELDLGNGRNVDVTLDITLKDEEAAKEKYKADVMLFSWKKISYQNQFKDWNDRITKYANEVIKKFNEKTGNEIPVLSFEDIEESKKQEREGIKMKMRKERAKHSLHRNRH